MDLAKSQDRLKRLQDEQQKLAKKINKKVGGATLNGHGAATYRYRPMKHEADERGGLGGW